MNWEGTFEDSFIEFLAVYIEWTEGKRLCTVQLLSIDVNFDIYDIDLKKYL